MTPLNDLAFWREAMFYRLKRSTRRAPAEPAESTHESADLALCTWSARPAPDTVLALPRVDALPAGQATDPLATTVSFRVYFVPSVLGQILRFCGAVTTVE